MLRYVCTYFTIFSYSLCSYQYNYSYGHLVATKEIGLEVNADKTKYMIMSRDQNAGRSHSMKTDNSSTERVEEFKYLGTTLLLLLLVFSPWAGLGRDQSSVRRLVWLWYAASWASS